MGFTQIFRVLKTAEPWLLTLLVLIILVELYIIYRRKHIGYRLTWRRKNVHGVMFGKLHGIFYGYSPEETEDHIIVFGSSGRGKTSAVLIPTLRSLIGGCLVLDIAGDIHPNVNRPDKLVFDPTNPNTIPYNVFAAIDVLKSIKAKNEALRNLAHQIIRLDNPGKSDPYFIESARNLFTAVLITFYHEGADFVDICRIVAHNSYASLESRLYEIGNSAAYHFFTQIGGGRDTTNSYIMQELVNKINVFMTSPVCDALRRPKDGELCITPACLENHSLFIVLPQEKLKLYAPLVRLISDQCFTYLYERPAECTRNILLCLDEFTEFGELDIEKGLRLLRKKHVRMLLLTQSLADLDRVYGRDSRQSMLNNLRYKLILGMSDLDEQKYFSALIGDRVVREPDGHGGYKEVRKPYYEPKDLEQLGDDLILVHPGGHTKFRKAYYWSKH